MILRLPLIVTLFCMANVTSLHAEQISRNSLVQYQHREDVLDCNLNLSNGIRIAFDMVLANEPENVVAHPLVILGIPTTRQFRFATIVLVSRYDDRFLAKVVKQDDERVFVALDSTFLNLFWGTDGSEDFSISDVDVGAIPQRGTFSTPDDMGAARVQLSKGKSCYEEALNSD
jgi:hypothetical protein